MWGATLYVEIMSLMKGLLKKKMEMVNEGFCYCWFILAKLKTKQNHPTLMTENLVIHLFWVLFIYLFIFLVVSTHLWNAIWEQVACG